MICPRCGKNLTESSEFCTYCGAMVEPPPGGGERIEQTPTPPQDQPPPTAGVTPPSGAPPSAPKPKRSTLPWILGGIGLAIVVTVALVLIFVVFGGETNTSGPELVVENFYKSLEMKNVDLMLETMDPDFVAQIEAQLGPDYRELLDTYFMPFFPDDLTVDITGFDTKMEGDRAEVKIVEGAMSYTDEYGDKVTESASEGDLLALELVKLGDSWYLSTKTLEENFNFDISQLEGVDEGNGYEDGGDTITLPVDNEDEILTLVLDIPEVMDWFLEVESPQYEISDENTSFVVHLFEYVEGGSDLPGHTATFGWYAVDKETGEVFEVAP
ncbi:MAG: zinc ribbon domain-containing protein [Actinomycetota bacterium]|nr:zinc ribbon domain-containing protein [Actinomycetota bacterium]